jgi:hypothetical protein
MRLVSRDLEGIVPDCAAPMLTLHFGILGSGSSDTGRAGDAGEL